MRTATRTVSFTYVQAYGCLSTVGTSTFLQRMMDQQVIDDLDTLISLDDKDIRSLCDVIRSPGGSVANPSYVQVGGMYLVGVNAYIHKNGTPVALVDENNLKLAVFYLKYMNRVLRPFPVSEVTVLNIKTVASLYKFERDY